ncbi:MAG: hypothetical protein HQK83_04380 [Fibrobacteria bacterium]|nr:hypothetical protein [Fibrobacteria bacterium]
MGYSVTLISSSLKAKNLVTLSNIVGGAGSAFLMLSWLAGMSAGVIIGSIHCTKKRKSGCMENKNVCTEKDMESIHKRLEHLERILLKTGKLVVMTVNHVCEYSVLEQEAKSKIADQQQEIGSIRSNLNSDVLDIKSDIADIKDSILKLALAQPFKQQDVVPDSDQEKIPVKEHITQAALPHITEPKTPESTNKAIPLPQAVPVEHKQPTAATEISEHIDPAKTDISEKHIPVNLPQPDPEPVETADTQLETPTDATTSDDESKPKKGVFGKIFEDMASLEEELSLFEQQLESVTT